MAKRQKKGVAPGRGGGGYANGRPLGQPPFIPTPELREAVMALVTAGTKRETIALVLRIPLRTLERHFASELHDGFEINCARIGSSIVADALAGDKTMRIFFAKAKMGWHDGHRLFADRGNGEGSPPALFTVSIT